MRTKVLIDNFFHLVHEKFFSVNIWMSNVLLMLSRLGKYDIDVILNIGPGFNDLEGRDAIEVTWERYFKGIFPLSFKKELRIGKAFHHQHVDSRIVYDYDVVIQPVTCYPIREVDFKKTVVIHYDFIPVEYLYGDCVPFSISHYIKNTKDKHIACISKASLDSFDHFLKDHVASSKSLPAPFQHLFSEGSAATASISSIISQFALRPSNKHPIDFSEDTKYILSIGSLELFNDRKNHTLTLKAWEKFCAMFPENKCKLILIGTFARTVEEATGQGVGGVLHQTLKKHLLAGDIIVLKRLEREGLIQLIKKAQCCVQPSRAEGFGMPVLEAMYFGCPVVVSDIPVYKWVVQEAGLFCNRYDVDSLVRCLMQLMVDEGKEKLRRELLRKGRENVKRFEFDQLAPLWEQFIDEIAAIEDKVLASGN